MTPALTLPPLLWSEAVKRDATGHAARRAAVGCDAGLVAYAILASELEAAMVLAPEVPLSRAMTMLPLCGVALQNALGALAPPEVAVHLTWEGGVAVNGATCGRFRVLSASRALDAVPDWLVVGFTLRLLPASDDPGDTPDETALFVEGCADIDPAVLIEAWARHSLNWIARWEDEGARALHAEWRGLVQGIGEPVQRGGIDGTFLGVDEDFGMLLRSDETTQVIPLTEVLEDIA